MGRSRVSSLACLFAAGCGRLAFDSDLKPDAPEADSSLVGWWRFEEGAGGVVADSSGNGNIGQLVNAPSWTIGHVGSGALLFDGVASYVDAGNRPSLNNIEIKTVSAWIKPIGTPTTPQLFVGKDASAACGWELSVGTNNQIRYRQCFNTDGVWDSAPGLAPAGQWHQVVVVHQRTLASQPTLYVDHVVQEMTVVQAPMGTVADESARSVGIGANAVDNSENFAGAIDEVRIYNRALSPIEIQQLP